MAMAGRSRGGQGRRADESSDDAAREESAQGDVWTSSAPKVQQFGGKIEFFWLCEQIGTLDSCPNGPLVVDLLDQ